jgi:hypothetical protein
MKFLCLAYGDEAGWNSLSDAGKQAVLAADAVIREAGHLMAAVRAEVSTVTNHDGQLQVSRHARSAPPLPLAGFSVIEADSLDEVVAMVAGTPCARAGGFIEIRPFWNDDPVAGSPRQ